MGNLADFIERYLKEMLENASRGMIEIRRRELARRFECVPSQINYVLATRFTTDRGYLVESRRGGGGYIRITRVRFRSLEDLLTDVRREIGGEIGWGEALDLLDRLDAQGLLDPEDKAAIRLTLHQETEGLPASVAGIVRAHILSAMLSVLLAR